jgi:hypothetical protein
MNTDGNRMTNQGPVDQRPTANDRAFGANAVLCPVCGREVEDLPCTLRRVLDGVFEEHQVCSMECRSAGQDSPFLQTSLFGGDGRVWTQSVQSKLPLDGESDRGDGDSDTPVE